MTVLTNKLKDPYRPTLFRGETVPSLDGLAGRIVMTVLMNKLKDPYRPALFRGETVQSLDGLAGGIVMTVQGNHAKTRSTTQDEDFPPLSEELPWTSLRPKGSQLRKNKRLYMEETTSRQRSRSRSEISLDRHKIRERVRCD
jgi:hypothetical protein